MTYLGWDQLYPVQKPLFSYHLAHSLRTNTIIADPSGQLLELQQVVERCFGRPDQIPCACKASWTASALVLTVSISTRPCMIMAWLFATGVTTHAILVAALGNPTIRLRYMAARDVLRRHGAVDGSRQLIRDGNHREAVFWITATFGMFLYRIEANYTKKYTVSEPCSIPVYEILPPPSQMWNRVVETELRSHVRHNVSSV
ncbi:hypothetical protein [Paenibacillus sp. GCM10027626]|uniref:hypothetical protein n=1 Tax=Paenibacillus sp. GCM10027626 TaxID=3273411 RepID=UPI00362A97B3